MATGSFRETSEPTTVKGKMRRKVLIGGVIAAAAAVLEAKLHPAGYILDFMRVSGERPVYQKIAGEFTDLGQQKERDIRLALYHAIGNASLNRGNLDEILGGSSSQAIVDFLNKGNRPYEAVGIFPYKRAYYPTVEILVRAIAVADRVKFAEEKKYEELDARKTVRGALLDDKALVLVTIPRGVYPTDLDQVSLFVMPQPAEYDEIAGTPRSGKSYVSVVKGSDLVRLADFADLFSRNNPHDNADTRFARLTQTAILNRYSTPIPGSR